MRASFGDVLRAELPQVPVTADAPLAPLTTFKVGGPADWLVEPASGDDLVRVVQLVLRHGLPLYYQRAFLDLFTPAFDWTSMRHGTLWSLLYAVVFTGLAYRHFRRKDVLS